MIIRRLSLPVPPVEVDTLIIMNPLICEDGASTDLSALIFNIRNKVCFVWFLKTQSFSELQFLLKDGTVARVEGIQLGHALNLR